MLYDIRLQITYEYDRPVAAGRHLLHVMPGDIPGVQEVRSSELTIHPEPTESRDIVDFFGNHATHMAFRDAHDEIAIAVHARVERLVHPPSLDMSPDLDTLAIEVRDCRSLDPDSPHHFTAPSPRIRGNRAMTDYARDRTSQAATVMEAARSVCLALHRDMTYDGEATTVETSPEEAFEERHGVCQDYAQIMIACLRGIGVPAGYVSGFLRTIPPEGEPRLEGADAMHAWVSVWCGLETGWVEFDPTNALLVGTDHIVVARGRDYDDVTPVAGVLRTAGSQVTDQSVDVKVVDEAPVI